MRRAGFALLLLVSCSDEGPLASSSGELIVSPTRLDFGRVFVGEEAARTVELIAQGGLPAEYRARFAGGRGEGLTAFPAAGRIPATERSVLTVRFRPTVVGPRETQILLDDGARTATITVQGEGRFRPDCEDGNICTEDRFDVELGRCVSESSTDICDDFDACTLDDQCAGGLCLGQGRSCDDGNVCTDDFCDARTGCVNVLTEACDDGNPCTEDLCDPNSGCRHEPAEDRTPCGSCRACFSGRCEIADLADGRACDDGDVCTRNEVCSSGACLDPDFSYPADGELQWTARVGPLAPGAADNPVVDVDGTTFVGTVDGVVSVGPCGEEGPIQRRDLGPPLARSMLISPLGLSVPFEDRVLDLDRTNGQTLSTFVLDEIVGLGVETASVSIQDMSIRSSGALLLSLWLDRPGEDEDGGALVSLGPERLRAELVTPLGSRYARRVVVDLDEVPILLLQPGPPGATNPTETQVVRLGFFNEPETRWSAQPLTAPPSELSIDAARRVLWSGPLLSVSLGGEPASLGSVGRDVRGALITDRDRLVYVDTRANDSDLVGLSASTGTELYRVSLPGPAPGFTPVSDGAGAVYVATQDGWLVSVDRDGRARWELDLGYREDGPISVTINPEQLIIVIAEETVFGVETELGLNTSAWPRRRRDNFGTARR